MAPDDVFQPSHIHTQHPSLDTSPPCASPGKSSRSTGSCWEHWWGPGCPVPALGAAPRPRGEGSSSSPGRELGQKWDADGGGVGGKLLQLEEKCHPSGDIQRTDGVPFATPICWRLLQPRRLLGCKWQLGALIGQEA